MSAAALIDEYLLLWVLLSVGVGLVVPSAAVLTPLSTPILAVMIGAVSLTLAPERFRQLSGRALLVVLVVQTRMPLLAFAIARTLGLTPAFTAEFVVLGAVTPELMTPELVTPTMTELSGDDTALSTVVLVVVGLGTLVFALASSPCSSGSPRPSRWPQQVGLPPGRDFGTGTLLWAIDWKPLQIQCE